ncbi:MAG TPA: DUF2642 domain-containing protein [Thermoanaerobaculia bacterium]
MRTIRLLLVFIFLSLPVALPLAADEPTLVVVLNRWKGRTVMVSSPDDERGQRSGTLAAIGRDHIAVKEGGTLRYIPVSAIREVRVASDEDQKRAPVIVLR